MPIHLRVGLTLVIFLLLFGGISYDVWSEHYVVTWRWSTGRAIALSFLEKAPISGEVGHRTRQRPDLIIIQELVGAPLSPPANGYNLLIPSGLLLEGQYCAEL